MAEKMFLADIPEEVKEEISLLYRIGIGIEEIEYIISIKSRKGY